MRYKFIFLCAYAFGGTISLPALGFQNDDVLPLHHVVIVTPEKWPTCAQSVVKTIHKEWPTIPESYRFMELEHATQIYMDQGIHPAILQSFLKRLSLLSCPLHPESKELRFDHDQALLFYKKALETLTTLPEYDKNKIFLHPHMCLSLALSSSVDFVRNVVCTPQEGVVHDFSQFFGDVFLYALKVTLETPPPLENLETDNETEDEDDEFLSPPLSILSDRLYSFFEVASEVQREGTPYHHQYNIRLAYHALECAAQNYDEAYYVLKNAISFMEDAHTWDQYHNLVWIIHNLYQKTDNLAPLNQAFEVLKNTLVKEKAAGTYNPETILERLQQLTI